MVIIKLQKSYQCQFLWLCGCYQNCQEQKQNCWTHTHHVSIKTKQKKTKKTKKTKKDNNTILESCTWIHWCLFCTLNKQACNVLSAANASYIGVIFDNVISKLIALNTV